MKHLLTILFLYLFSYSNAANSPAPYHEFHVSKCNIEYRADQQILKITLHLFIDDLEIALTQNSIEPLHIGTAKEHPKANQFIHQYLQEKLHLKSASQALSFTFSKKEQSEDLVAIWCYLEVKNMNPIKQLTVTNEVLMDIFDDQKNIIRIKGPQNQSAYFLYQKGKSTESVKF